MALQWQNRDVNLLPLNQQAPHSLGPIGRVDTLTNGLVTKFLNGGSGPRMRIQKRPGMTSLPTTVYSGGTAGTVASAPKLLDTFADRLVMVGKTTPYVFSEARNAWQEPLTAFSTPPSIAPQQLYRQALYSAGSRANIPDTAWVGDVGCYSLLDSSAGALVLWVDHKGVQILAPVSPTGTAFAKVVSDGAQFWVFSQATARTSTYIQVFDTQGHQLAASTIAWGSARANWDVGYQSVNGKVALFTPTGATLTVTLSSYAGGVITSTTTTPTSGVTGVAWLANVFGSTNYYVAGADNAGNVTGYEIASGGGVATTYVVAATLGTVGNITGYVTNNSFDITVCCSVLQDNTSAPSFAAINNQVQVYRALHSGASSLAVNQRSLGLVSRAFVDGDGIWRVVAYYQSTASSLTTPVQDTSAFGADPTFFVMDLSATVPLVVGSFELGNAYAYYATSRDSQDYNPWHLSSVGVDAESLYHIPLCYLGTQQSYGVGYLTTGSFSNLSAVNDYQISLIPGTCVQAHDVLLIPGLQADGFDGQQFAELAPGVTPQVVSLTNGAGGGSLTPGELYTYVWCYAWSDAAGNTYRGAMSSPVPATPSSTKLTFVLSTDRVTARLGVWIECYRTFSPTGNTTPGTELRMVGRVANVSVADTVTFVDTFSDAAVSLGVECYAQVLTASPATGRYTAPPFSSGISAYGTTYVVGFDNAVWFSGPQNEGDGIWFSPQFRITIPTSDRILRLIPMDARLVIVCSESLWTVPLGGLPNANLTSGSIPTPEQLPFTTNALGPAVMTPGGAVYSAPQGIWNMDRGLNSTFLGAGVIDEVNSSAHPTALVASAQQRIYSLMSTDGSPSSGTAVTTVLVYDLIVGAWYKWVMPTAPAFATIWKGKFAWVDFANCAVHVEDATDASTYSDDGAAIITTIGLSFMAFGGPNDWERLWGLQFYGEWYGPHVMTVTYEFNNVAAVDETYQVPFGVDPGVYRTELRQNTQKDESVEVTFQDGYSWPSIATITGGFGVKGQIIVSTVTGFVVGQSYSTQTGGVLDTGHFTVNAIDPVLKTLTVGVFGGWTLHAGHTITYQTNSLATFGNTFSLEAITLRIGMKAGMTKLPTARRAAP